jgi:hypothetical protein
MTPRTPPSWLIDIAAAARDQVDVTVHDRLTRDHPTIHAHVETLDGLVGSENIFPNLIEQQVDRAPFRVVEIEIGGCVATRASSHIRRRFSSVRENRTEDDAMVVRYTASGFAYGVPPYTKAENRDFWRRIGNGPVAFTRPWPSAPAQEKQQDQPGEQSSPRPKP